WESQTLAANFRNAAIAVPHREVSARAWRGFPGNANRKTWAQPRHTAPVILHRTSNVRPSKCALVPAMRIVVLLDTHSVTVPFRPPAWKSSPTGLVIAWPQARLHRGVSSSPTVSSIPEARNTRQRNPDHAAPSR